MAYPREIRHVVDPVTECWNCISHKPDSHGYPRRWAKRGQERKIFRMMYSQFKGKIPTGMLVRHTCDNRLCINPDHLLLGTIADNIRDSIERGRHITLTGKAGSVPGAPKKFRSGPCSPKKLTADDARFIKNSSDSDKKLASIYGVHQKTIYNIKKGKIWKHIMDGSS